MRGLEIETCFDWFKEQSTHIFLAQDTRVSSKNTAESWAPVAGLWYDHSSLGSPHLKFHFGVRNSSLLLGFKKRMFHHFPNIFHDFPIIFQPHDLETPSIFPSPTVHSRRQCARPTGCWVQSGSLTRMTCCARHGFTTHVMRNGTSQNNTFVYRYIYIYI